MAKPSKGMNTQQMEEYRGENYYNWKNSINNANTNGEMRVDDDDEMLNN